MIAYSLGAGIEPAGDFDLSGVVFRCDQQALTGEVLIFQAGEAEKFQFADPAARALPADKAREQAGTKIQLTGIVKQLAFGQTEALSCQGDVQLGPIWEVDQLREYDWRVIKNSMNKG